MSSSEVTRNEFTKAEEDKKIDLSIFVWTRFEKTLKTLVFRVAEEKVFERNRLIKQQSISYCIGRWQKSYQVDFN